MDGWVVHDGEMKTFMKLQELKTIDQLQAFLCGTQAVAFRVISDKDECYSGCRASWLSSATCGGPARI